jgi:hypothetical protein
VVSEQATASDPATVDDHAVTDSYVIAYLQQLTPMENAVVLNVGARSDTDRSEVASDDGPGPHARSRTEVHVTDDVGRLTHPGRRVDLGDKVA